jgi:hypothetical protein
MTVFEFLTGGFFGDREDEAEYFMADAEWVVNASKQAGVDTSELEELKDSAYEKMSSGNELDSRESRFVAACLVGDAYWADPLARWAPTFSRPMVYLSEPFTRRRWLKIAEKYYDLDKLKTPSYSYPSDLAIGGRNPRKHVNGFKQRAVIGAAVLDLEWLEYVLKAMDIEYPEPFFKKTICESVKYFAFGGQMSDEEKKFQEEQLRLAGVWMEELIVDYHIRSYILDKADITVREGSRELKNDI